MLRMRGRLSEWDMELNWVLEEKCIINHINMMKASLQAEGTVLKDQSTILENK